jgi:hypothetical protein
MLDKREDQVEFGDREVFEYLANVIAGNLYSIVDTYVRN